MTHKRRVVFLAAALVVASTANISTGGADVSPVSPWLRFIEEFEMSPDGEFIVFAGSYEDANTRLYSRPTDGGKLNRLTPPNRDVRLSLPAAVLTNGWAISHDSQRVVYRAGNSAGVNQLYTVPIAGGTPKRINTLIDPGDPFVQPREGVYNFWVSPNSSYVVWVEVRNTSYSLWTAATNGSGRRRLHSAGASFLAPSPSIGGPWPLAFSPSGSEVTMGIDDPATGRTLVEAVLAGGSDKVLRTNLPAEFAIGRLRYTADGQAVIYSADGNFYQPVSGASATALTPNDVPSFGVSRGGEWALYEDDNGAGLTGDFAIRLDGTFELIQVGPFRANGRDHNTSWDDSYFYYDDGTALFRRPMVAGGMPQQVQSVAMTSSVLSPDNSYFYGRVGFEYWVVPTLPGPKPKKVFDQSPDQRRFTGFSPDSDRFGIDMADGATTYTRDGQADDIDPRNKYAGVTDVKFLERNKMVFVGYRNSTEGALFVATAEYCDGFLATHVGTNGADTIIGSKKKDVMVGRGGDDTLNGRLGNDHLCGGPGNDLLRGNRGHDALFGNTGNDTLLGSYGTDKLNGGSGTDSCITGETLIACE